MQTWHYIAGGAILSLIGLRKFLQGPVCTIEKNLEGHVIIITGANTGIGSDTARRLAELKATVILACRSKERTQAILEELQSKYGKEKIDFIPLDLSDLESVSSFIQVFKKKYQRLDQLINNAGVMALKKREETKQKLEMQFGTNHIGHFALTLGLLDLLKKTPQSRVITVSSSAHQNIPVFPGTGKIYFEDIQQKDNYRPWVSYSQSKLANILFTKELNRIFLEQNILSKAVCLHPGAVATELQRHQTFLENPVFTKFFFKDQFHGAQTTLYCSLVEYSKLQGGEFYADCKISKSTKESKNMEDAKKLWQISEQILKQNNFKF